MASKSSALFSVRTSAGHLRDNSYVLITAARNEQAFIYKTLQSVTSQTIPPKKWVIASDGSVDATDQIVLEFSRRHPYIHLIRIEPREHRNFRSKVHAIRKAYSTIAHLSFSFIGILDADVSFPSTYYEAILSKFCRHPGLGIAGGIRYDFCNGAFKRVSCSTNSVGGPFQLFDRTCYDQIGGLAPIEIGGEDAVAEIRARMHGWVVRSFDNHIVYHHRCTGSASAGRFRAALLRGKRDFTIGYHPLFEICRCLLRLVLRPPDFLSILVPIGYFSAWFSDTPIQTDTATQRYLRKEQLSRLRSMLFSPGDAFPF